MPLLTVEGIFKDGRVELAEHPGRVGETVRVLVTFLPGSDLGEQQKTGPAEARETLRQRAFARMREGIHFGGPPYPKREELYDRFGR